MIVFFLMAWIWTPSEELLVLKNGKLVTCDSYQVDGQRISITRKAETFSLPVSLVDWDRTKVEVERRRVATEKHAEAEAERLAELERKRTRTIVDLATREQEGPIVLTNDHLARRFTVRGATPVAIRYRKIGNSIIVPVTINGRGPYDFVLDTGAAATLVSPGTITDLGIVTGAPTQLTGVGGRPMSAATAVLETVSMGGARVNGLTTVVRAIQPLNAVQVVGLLGQDFLDHFVMNLDSASLTLTLTPHGVPTDSGLNAADLEKIDNIDRVFNELDDIINQLTNATAAYLESGEAGAPKRYMSQLKHIGVRLPQLHGQIKELHTIFRGQQVDETTDDFMRCYPLFDSMLRAIHAHTRVLRQVFSRPADDATKQRVMDHWQRVGNRADKLQACYG